MTSTTEGDRKGQDVEDGVRRGNRKGEMEDERRGTLCHDVAEGSGSPSGRESIADGSEPHRGLGAEFILGQQEEGEMGEGEESAGEERGQKRWERERRGEREREGRERRGDGCRVRL